MRDKVKEYFERWPLKTEWHEDDTIDYEHREFVASLTQDEMRAILEIEGTPKEVIDDLLNDM